jgi:hypothetical protein
MAAGRSAGFLISALFRLCDQFLPFLDMTLSLFLTSTNRQFKADLPALQI